MKITKTIIADTYEAVIYTNSSSKLASLSKTDYVNTVYGLVDENLNRIYTNLYNKFSDVVVAGLDHEADDYSKRLRNAIKRLAAVELVCEHIIRRRHAT